MSGIAELLTVANTYRKAEGIRLSQVSSRALNDSKRLPAMERGEVGITVDRLERTLRWFSKNWPDVPWPTKVPRP